MRDSLLQCLQDIALKVFTRQLERWDRSSKRSDLELYSQESSK